MADYRLYCIRDGHFFHCEAFPADSDDAAMAEALRRQPNQAAELWSGARKVLSFDTKEAAKERS